MLQAQEATMVDPISTQAATGAVGGVGQTGLAEPSGIGGPGPVNQHDAARFSEAMQEGAGPAAAQESAAAGQTTGVNAGDPVLEGMDKLSADMRAMQDKLVQSTSGMGEMGDLIRVQFEVARLTTTQTMVGQVGQKTSQGTQQLLKGQ
jgi:hypothetical protein